MPFVRGDSHLHTASEVSQHIHIESPGHTVDLEGVRILDTEQDYFKRGIKEAIYIRALQPSLNLDGGRYRLQTTVDPLLTSHVGKITCPQHLGQIAEEDWVIRSKISVLACLLHIWDKFGLSASQLPGPRRRYMFGELGYFYPAAGKKASPHVTANDVTTRTLLKFLGLKIPIYHSVLVDQRCSRAIHHCDVCNVVQRLESGAAIVCKSIHYGVCQPVAIPPTKARIIKKREEKATAKVSPHSPPAKPQLSPQPKVADQLSPQPKVVTEVKPTTSATPSPKSDPPNPAPSGASIPRFYFPLGQPVSDDGKELKKVSEVFGTMKEGKAYKNDFGEVAKVCSCPLYWKGPLFLAAGGDKLGCVTSASFQPMWKRIIQKYHDDYSRFMAIMTRMKRSYLTADDFVPLIQDVIDTHPGLTFLQEAQEFHSRYLHTVIARIFYTVNRSWSGQITIPELRKSNLLQVISSLEEEDDINQITDFFSYEHFYVIYCKFWELDTDHDLFISQQDLARHNDGAISSRMAERIFSGAVTRGSTVSREGKMSYTEFVWFLLAEEDKKHPTAIEYWFRCMDLDGDGLLSMYELEYFYEEQYNKMVSLGIEPMPFEDCLCQMLDMINPTIP
ncbi:Serine/threonine-protein phosphatase 2A regulatory subunit B'' subunit alpha, partial [Branchiostoma belcheri]